MGTNDEHGLVGAATLPAVLQAVDLLDDAPGAQATDDESSTFRAIASGQMRVQIIYGEHTAEEFPCFACASTGTGGGGGRCWVCLGAGNLAAGQRTYTYGAPEGTKLWDVLITPTPQQGGKRGTVVKLSSEYDGPVREAYPIPTFPCKGNCGTVLQLGRGGLFCDACWALVPEAMKANLREARGFESVKINRAIAEYLSVVAPAPRPVRMDLELPS
jgi:hypothetical protein